jgi:hypothetical protein
MVIPTRKQRFRNLMINRTTVEQGPTFKQIFCEVYSDVVEKYIHEKDVTGRTMLDVFGGDIIGLMDYNCEYGKIRYLRRMIKHVRKTDDSFRWLSIMPVKRNEVNKNDGKKVRPYLEYKYININATKTPELLEQVNAFWFKHNQACMKGLEKKKKRLEALEKMLSTPEGRAQQQKSINDKMAFINFAVQNTDNPRTKTTDENLDRMVADLKRQGKLPENYKTNHERLRNILHEELLSEEAFRRLSDEERQLEQIYNAMKDTILAYFNPKDYQIENKKKEEYD